jgi:hypothetical protein
MTDQTTAREGIVHRTLETVSSFFLPVCKQNMSGTESKAAQNDAVAASPDFRAKSGDFAVQTDNLCLHTFTTEYL